MKSPQRVDSDDAISPAQNAGSHLQLLDVPTTARRLGISRSALYVLVKEREIRPLKLRGRTLFREDELDAWIAGLSRAGE